MLRQQRVIHSLVASSFPLNSKNYCNQFQSNFKTLVVFPSLGKAFSINLTNCPIPFKSVISDKFNNVGNKGVILAN